VEPRRSPNAVDSNEEARNKNVWAQGRTGQKAAQGGRAQEADWSKQKDHLASPERPGTLERAKTAWHKSDSSVCDYGVPIATQQPRTYLGAPPPLVRDHESDGQRGSRSRGPRRGGTGPPIRRTDRDGGEDTRTGDSSQGTRATGWLYERRPRIMERPMYTQTAEWHKAQRGRGVCHAACRIGGSR